MAKSSLDKDLKKLVRLEAATRDTSQTLLRPGLLLLFMMAALLVTSVSVADMPLAYLVIIASLFAAYMALNIGANDVANNMGPAVGSRVLSMPAALLIAATFEASGAILAGGDVVNTVSKDLIVADHGLAQLPFMLAMMSALLSAALWIHLATFIGAPVSTTHAIIGGVVGGLISAASVSIVNWSIIGAIAASWVISPVLGGVIAAALLGFIKFTILFRDDKLAAAQRWVPVIVAFMAAMFAMYLCVKGLNRIWHPSMLAKWSLTVVAFGLSYFMVRPWVRRRALVLDNTRKDVATLFAIPLIGAVSLLSFAHGANDVANAVGPLAAIFSAAQTGTTSDMTVELPLWILAIGASGIALGLMLFGPKLIRTVGEKITRMNPIRAYCVALSAAFTVLLASALGLPVSSTHIAIGAVFGVGYLREALSNQSIPRNNIQPGRRVIDPSVLSETPEAAIKNAQKRERRMLVRREHMVTIFSAWVMTVPAAALLAMVLYRLLGLFAF